jgi:hypothetical protein
MGLNEQICKLAASLKDLYGRCAKEGVMEQKKTDCHIAEMDKTIETYMQEPPPVEPISDGEPDTDNLADNPVESESPVIERVERVERETPRATPYRRQRPRRNTRRMARDKKNDDPVGVIGRTIIVYWPQYRKWYTGRVEVYNRDSEEYEVRYHDEPKDTYLDRLHGPNKSRWKIVDNDTNC